MSSTQEVEVAIIGAGPGGLSAAANAAGHGLSHVLVERAEIGNTVFDYQLGKHVMAEPTRLPLRSKIEFDAGSREEVLEKWQQGIKDTGVNLLIGDVTAVERKGDLFHVQVGADTLVARHLVLAIGVQGSPRKLTVPGSELDHLSYTLRDPGAFGDEDLLVIGAGDAAIENALALAEKNRVTILNRKDEFARAKDANNALILKAIERGEVRCFYNSNISGISSNEARIETAEGEISIPCTHVIARLGAVAPRAFLESCGIEFPGDSREAVPVVNEHYESNVPGLYLIGALVGYPLIKQAMNQGHEVIEHVMGNEIIPADQALIAETLQGLGEDVDASLGMIRDSLPLFSELSEPQYREMVIDSTVHQLAQGAVVFEKNEYSNSFFSVINGCAEIELDDELRIPIGAGEFFGEMGLLSGRRRNATVRMAEAGILLETPRRQMLKLLSSVEAVRARIDQHFMRNALCNSLFPDVDRSFVEAVVKEASFRNFKKGEVLIREGDIGEELFVIRKGSVRISRKTAEGKDVTQVYLSPGHFAGEMALLESNPAPRTATVTAAVACETIVVSRDAFRSVLIENVNAHEYIERISEQRRIENMTSDPDEYRAGMLDFILEEGISDADNALIIDSDLCIGCDNCEQACAATHDGYSRLDRKGGKSFAAIQLPVSCRHCENPLCMVDCPPDALVRRPDGEVVIQDSCIGCGNCASNCPYGVIQMVYDRPPAFSLLSWLGIREARSEGMAKAGKCDMCVDLSSGPACVRSCPTGAAMRVHPRKIVELVSSK